MTNRPSKFDLSLLYYVQSIFSSTYFIHESVIGQCMFTIERCFSTEMTEKSVQCSELGGVHLAEVYLQQKSIGCSETSVPMGGVHYREVFINRGFTVF